jgi:alginate O-acetyltransferase complex protein AlgI
MSLISFGFLLGFLPCVVIGVHVLRDRVSTRAAQALVLAASLVFYTLGGPTYVPLLIGSITFNWAVGRALGASGGTDTGRKRLLWLGLAVNILVLCTFKYVNFLLSGFGAFLGRPLALPNWAFPLGISFFTLAQVMYLVDVYERLVPANSFFNHATFVSFFPNVTAGPIERVKNVVGQFINLGAAEGRDERIARGIALMAMGLFKKVVIADSFSRIANAGYGTVSTLSTAEAWMTTLAYTFELYFDFSGYSDLAVGAGQLLGIRLIQNFNVPYRAKTISEFWQRWHISLSNFITTYLYTPMVRSMGRRVTIHKAAAATMIAMTIAGLWHGPAMKFILYGTMHGVALASNQYWKRRKTPFPPLLAIITTFTFVNVSLIIFRSPNLHTAAGMARRLLPADRIFSVAEIARAIPAAVVPMIALPIAIGSILAFAGPTSNDVASTFRPSYRAALAIVVLVVVSFIFMVAGARSDFVYRAF